MKIRPFGWRDVVTLYRYRHKSVFLHSSLLLTRGPLQVPGAVLSSLSPAMGVYTAVSERDGKTQVALIGQTIHSSSSQCAQITFLAPTHALDSDRVPALLEFLSARAVESGAFRLLADVDEDTQAFQSLRQLSFAIYARQRIWRLQDQPTTPEDSQEWRPASERDLIAVRSLYYNLTPGLVQQVEPFPSERLHGYVYRQGDDVLAFVELKYGHRGIWVQPFIHPDAESLSAWLIDLLQYLPYRLSRPIYICVRSYQSWLEQALESLGAQASPRQAMMVKHLAIPQKALRPVGLPALEGGQPEATALITQAQIRQGQEAGAAAVFAEKN